MKKLMILILLLTGQNLYSQSLKLTHPTGGEKFIIGSDTLITWEGIPETEPIRIEFSNDNGLSWQTITKSATGLKYKWENIRRPSSDECMIRVRQLKAPGIEWEKSYDGSNDYTIKEIRQTTDGGYIVGGNTASIDGDVSQNKGKSDALIFKLNKSGEIEWEQTYGGINDDYARSVKQTFDGGYIVAGRTGTIDSDGKNGYWILKLSPTGSLEWEKSYGGSDWDIATSIQQTNDKGFIVVGSSESSDGDVSENNGSSDFWVIKLDSTGSLEWEKSYGVDRAEQAYSVQQTIDGGYIIAGIASSNDWESYTNDYLIIKLNSKGMLEWKKGFGGSSQDWATSVQQTNDGGYIIAGYSISSDRDISISMGGYDYWILKLTSKGMIEWDKSYGGSGDEEATSIEKTNDGGYIVAGLSKSKDGDISDPNVEGGFWIIKINQNGDIEWDKSLGGNHYEFATSIQQTYDGGYIVAGNKMFSREGKTDRDYLIVKLYPDENQVIQSDSSGLFSIEMSPENIKKLNLTHPKGNEKFLVGSNMAITWDGIPEAEPVKLEFSNDYGQTWQTLSDSVTGLKYYWENIPNIPSDECIIRIKQLRKHAFTFEPHGINWERNFGGSQYDEATSIQQTNDGGYIVAGWTFSNDDDISKNNGSSDYWIIKLKPDGTLDWEKIFGGTLHDEASSIQQTNDGGYIVAGFTVSSDKNISENNGSSDYWIIKLNPDGTIDWEKSYGGGRGEYAYSIEQTLDRGYIIAGLSYSNDGDISENKGESDYWIIKLNPDGTLDWEKSFGGSDRDEAYSIQQTNDGGYIVAGFTLSGDGDISGSKKYSYDYWIIKLSPDGTLDWEKSFGESTYSGANSIQQTNDGGYIVAGFTSSVEDVTEAYGGYDYRIIKLNADGTIEWKRNYGGREGEKATSIQLTNDGGYIVAGYSNSSDSYVSENKGGYDYWILKLSSAGKIQWEQSFGGSRDDIANCIEQTNDDGYIVVGRSASFDGDVSENNGGSDFWIVKLYPDEILVNQSDSSGLFSIAMPPEDARLLDNSGIYSITPNPADNEIKIVVTIKEAGYTELALYNIVGQKVNEIFSGEVSEIGVSEFTGYISNLAIGYYYLVFQTPTVKDSKSIMIAR